MSHSRTCSLVALVGVALVGVGLTIAACVAARARRTGPRQEAEGLVGPLPAW